MNEEKIINGYYQSNIKTSRNEDSVYAMKYANQQMLIDKLQQENARLKDKNKKVLELLQILHYNFPDYDEMHKKVEDIEEILKEN